MNMHGGRECLNEKMLPPRSEVATQACPDAVAHDRCAVTFTSRAAVKIRFPDGFLTRFKDDVTFNFLVISPHAHDLS